MRSLLRQESAAGYLFVLPAIILLIWLVGIPFAQGIHYSFTDWRGSSSWSYVGFDNYVKLFQNQDFYTAVKNNTIVILTVPLWVFVPLMLAAAIHSKVTLAKFYKSVYFFPSLLSPVIIGMIFKYLLSLDGAANYLLTSIGLSNLVVDWLATEHISMLAITFVFVWSTFGTSVIIYLAGLANVNPEVIEAAKIDGASWMQTFVSITIPSIKPIVELGFMLSLIGSFKSIFIYIYILTYGGPANSTSTMDFMIYRLAFRSGEMGMSAALGIVMLVFALLSLLLCKVVFFRGNDYE